MNYKDFIDILTKFITIVKKFDEPTDNHQKWFEEKSHEIEILNEKIDNLLKSCEDFDNHGGQQQQQQLLCIKNIKILLHSFDKSIESFKMKLLSNCQNSTNTSSNCNNNNNENDYEIEKQKQMQSMVIRLSLIMIHMKTVVGLMIIDYNNNGHNLLISENDNHQPKPPSILLNAHEQSSIRLSLCHTLCLSFMNILKYYFTIDNNNSMSWKNFEKIFPITLPDNMMTFQNYSIEKQLSIMKLIYAIYLQLLFMDDPSKQFNVFSPLIRQTLFDNGLSMILTIFIIYRSLNQQQQQQESIDYDPESLSLINDLNEKFQQKHFENQTYRSSVIRNLVALLALSSSSSPKSETSKKIFNTIVNMFRNHLINPKGLHLLIDSTLESDYYSQRETTVIHRLQAMITMIVNLPVKNKQAYYAKIFEQLLNEFLLTDNSQTKTKHHQLEVYHQFASKLLQEINSKSLIDQIIFDKLMRSFKTNDSEDINIEKSISIIEILVINRSCLKKLSKFFTPLFYLRLQFEFVENQILISTIKEKCDKILRLMLEEMENSYYLLDSCLQKQQQSKWLQHYRIEFNDSMNCIIGINEDNNMLDDNRLSLKQMDKFIVFIDNLLDKMSLDFCFNFFFLLLEHLMDKDPSPVILFSIESLSKRLFGSTITKQQENDRETFLLTNERTIHFLNNTFERITRKIVQIPIDNYDDNDATEHCGQIWFETLSICLRILAVLLEKIEQFSSTSSSMTNETIQKLLNDMNPCYNQLKILLQNSNTMILLQDNCNNESFELIENLYRRFDKILKKNSSNQIKDKDNDETKDDLKLQQLQSAINDLQNNDFMPGQVHSLIVLRRLVESNRHPSIDAMLNRIIETVQEILNNSQESYVYLAAIRTLSALAINYTDHCLPILLNELINTQKPLSDRLKIGEIIVQLTYSIGDFAHHYSKQFINGMLLGIKSNEPAIRISCLSCLGEFCRRYPLGLSKYIVELMSMIESILMTEKELDVKRSAILFLHLLLKGIETEEQAFLIENHLKNIKNLILNISNRTIDDVLQRHCSNAYEQISRIAKLLLK